MRTVQFGAALLVVLAILLGACGGEDEATTPTPAPAPTETPAPTPIPSTPTPEPVTAPAPSADTAGTQPAADAMTFTVPDFSAETTGMEVAEALFTQEEQGCIRAALGDEAAAALLSSKVLDPAVAGSTAVFGECLSQETSVTLFLAGVKAVAGGALSESTLNCIGNAVAPNYAVLFTEELDPVVMFSFIPCLSPEELAALTALAPQ